MNEGRCVCRFRIDLIGMALDQPALLGPIDGAQVELAPDAEGLSATVTIEHVTREDGIARAEVVMRRVYTGLLLRFAEHIERATPPHRVLVVHHVSDEIALSAGGIGRAAGRATVAGRGCAVIKTAAIQDLERSLPSTAAIKAATVASMFAAGMQAEDEVVRYLITYSALALLGGNQDGVDRLIKQVEAGVTMKKSPHTGRLETVYTATRNDFVHTEHPERPDPMAAAEAIRQLLPKFHALVAQVIRRELGI